MEQSIIVAGFGGQGVQMLGKLLSYTACEETDKFVTYFASYSMQMRGGTSDCYVAVSDKKVGAPKFKKADYLLLFSPAALQQHKDHLKAGGTMIINTGSIHEDVEVPEGCKLVKVDVVAGSNEAGSLKAQNLVMLGAFIGCTDLFDADAVQKTIDNQLGKKKPEMLPINRKAFEIGLAVGRTAK